MRRPTRPFVVEVKKKRGNLAQRRSIWGDLDLSAVASDSSDISEDAQEAVGNEYDLGPVVPVGHGENTGSVVATAADSGDVSPVTDSTRATQDSAAVQTESNIESPARSSRKRGRRLKSQRRREGDVGNAGCPKLFAGDGRIRHR